MWSTSDQVGECQSCNAPIPKGLDLCPGCRTERLPKIETHDLKNNVLCRAYLPPSPLHGRGAELHRLVTLANEVVQSREVRFCLVVGSSGIGKTRLMYELAQVLTSRHAPPIRTFIGAAAEGAPPLSMIADQLSQRLEIQARDGKGTTRDTILRACRSLLTGVRATEVANLLSDILRVTVLDGSLEERRDIGARHYLGLKRFLAADAERGPIALLFDEMEHASPEAVNLLHYLAAGLPNTPILLCAFATPEIDELYPTFGHGEISCHRIELGPLAQEDSAALLKSLLRSAGEVPQKIVSHAQGCLKDTPRLVVELVRYLLEVGVVHLGENLRVDAGQPNQKPAWDHDALADLILPDSMDKLVSARISALAPDLRDVLERASISGEQFFLEAVVAQMRAPEFEVGDPDGPSLEEIVVSGDRSGQHVSDILGELERRGLVSAFLYTTIPGERSYRFSYRPWRDAIYDAIPLPQRRKYHALLSQWLDMTPESHREDMQESIGKHLERAGKGDQAALRYAGAAEQARDRYAHGRATRLFARAIACLGGGELATRIRLWHELGVVFHNKGDYDNALSAYEKVVRLSWVIASRGTAAQALLQMGQIWRQKGELQLALDYLGQALDLFRQRGDQWGISDTLDDTGQVLWLLGRYDGALERSAAALERRRRLGDRSKVATSLLNIGNIERHRGLFEAAEACYLEALDIRRKEKDKAGIAACLNAIGVLAHQRGNTESARHAWEEALGLVDEVGASPLRAVLLYHLGEGLLQQGQLTEAEARFLSAQKLAQELSDKRLNSEILRSLGLVALGRGDPQLAESRCRTALELAEESGVRLNVARTLLALGEVYAATLFDENRGGERSALEYFQRGVNLLRDIGNEAELGGGFLRLGRYMVEHGQIQAGRELLSEAEALFLKLGAKAGEQVREMLQEI